MAKSRDYWRQRFEALEEAQFQKSETYFKDLEKAYKQTMIEIEKDISRWYQRFADNNEISLAEAKRLLKSDELKELRWTVEEYIKYGEENALNQQWMKQLENASSRVHISRLESLRLQLQQHVEKLYGGRIESFEKLMKEVYQEQYYQTVFTMQSAFEIGFAFQTLNDDVLTKVISKPWTLDGTTFSSKIWKDKNSLIDTLQKELVQSFARGESPQRMIAAVKNRLDVSKSNAARLVQTEASFFGASAQRDAFKALDVEQYEIVATLDSRTSTICRGMDGKVFLMADFEPGVTANPFHPRCRTTTAPYFEDETGERFARGADGKTYTVPGNLKYEEWKEKYVDTNSKTINSENKEVLTIPKVKQAQNVIPNSNSAIFIDNKLTGYALRKDHPTGGPKAVLFESLLGYNLSNWNDLKQNVMDNLPESYANYKGYNGHGETYETIMNITGPSGKNGYILMSWIILNEEESPRLTSIYIIDEQKAKKKIEED